MRRRIIPWLIAAAVLLAATVGGVAAANATVFGAGAFVRSYLDAVARGDVADALRFAGVEPDGDALLLREDALAGLHDIRQLADEEVRPGVHRVSVAWSAPGGSGTTDFVVRREGSRFGLFPLWRFEQSPTATIEVTVLNDRGFFVNDLTTQTADTEVAEAEGAVRYAVLVPGVYEFGHESGFFTAARSVVIAGDPGGTATVEIDVQANDTLGQQLQELVDEALAECTQQQVLFPTGCPFGQSIENRVVSDPSWTIVKAPDVAVAPGEEFGSWVIPKTAGTAHLRVDVQELFDGSVSTFDEDVPFEVEFAIAFTGPTTVELQPR